MNILADLPTSSTAETTVRSVVRIVIVGHVDHGKSTLIGRLLHETGSLPEGKVDALKAVSTRRGMHFEWSFLLDALQTERDQGITLDTSQIRFRTKSRDVILIDAPGHAEFLRNMITGAAQADAALLIVDASEGVRDQTRRHGYLLYLLGIRQVAVVINKMDRVEYDEGRFHEIETEIRNHLVNLGLTPIAVIPISARHGDGVARRAESTAWYQGPNVLEALDNFSAARPDGDLALRLPVQAVYKFDDRRIIAGRVETGRITVGQTIVVLPSGKTAKVRTIEEWPAPDASHPPQAARAGQSIGITLDRELFAERGEVISIASVRPKVALSLNARVFWLHDAPLEVGQSVNVRIGTADARATVVAIENAVDPGHLETVATHRIARNHVGEIRLVLARPIVTDPYALNPRTGRLVLDIQGRIAGGGLVLSADSDAVVQAKPSNIVPVVSAISDADIIARRGHTGAILWLTGLPGAGKSTLARSIERRIFDRGGTPILLDGDTLRAGLNSDLGFSPQDRSENVRRLAEVAAHLARNGFIAIVAAISPAAADRVRAREIGKQRFHEIYVDAPQEVCERRDPNGQYRQARAGAINGFTGVGAPYEPPTAPDLRIDTDRLDVKGSTRAIEKFLETTGVLRQGSAPAAADFDL